MATIADLCSEPMHARVTVACIIWILQIYWPSPFAGSSLPQAGGEFRVFRRFQAVLHQGEDGGQIAAQERGGIQPESREHRAAQAAVRSRGERLVRPLAEYEPVDSPIADTADQIFADTVAPVSAELVVQVVTGGAGRDFGDEIRRALDVAVLVDLNLTAMLGLDEEHTIGLWLVVEVQPHGAADTSLHPRSPGFVMSQPTQEVEVLFAVVSMTNR